MNIERIQKVIQTEATTPYIGDFLLTHAPFENLYLDKDNTKAIYEEKLLNILISNPEEHKFILVQGNNGSGKSHLIRWLKEKYVSRVDKDKEAVLLISRAHNTLQDALTQLLEADIFPNEIRENELKAIKSAKSNITGEELKKTINFNFTLEIEADKNNRSTILDLRYRDWLIEYLNNAYIQNEYLLKENGPLERIRGKIETVSQNSVSQGDAPMFIADDLAITLAQISKNLDRADGRAAGNVINLAQKFADARIGAELRQKTADYLNTKVSSVIGRSLKLQTADFKKLFASLRKILKIQGMSLTLFVEDINSFTGIDEALMEVLLTDHRAEGNYDYCRITSVVGSTPAFYRDKLNASIKERIKNNIYIHEKSVLGSKEQLAKFAARYINAINLSDEQVREWDNRGASDNDIPIFNSPFDWAKVDCDGNMLSIFPFNENALWKLYSGMDVSKKTPRVFLKSIIAHVLKLWCESKETLLLDENNFINADISMPRWDSSLYNEGNTAIDANSAIERGILLKLWGDGTTKRESGRLGGLTADVFKAFNVYADITGEPKPNTQTSQKEKTSEEIKVPIPVQPVTNTKNKPEKLMELEIDLEEWLKYGKTLSNHVIFRDCLYPFISSGIDWELEGVPMLLVTNLINLRGRVHIEGQNISLGEGYLLLRNKETQALLIALANWKYYGNNSWNFEGSSDYLVTAIAWLDRHKKEIIESVIAPKGQTLKWKLPLWNVAAVYAIKTLFGGLDISKSSEDIAVELLGTAPNFTEQTTHSKAWQDLKSVVTKNSDYKEKIVKDTLAYFSKSVGSAQAGETKYVFVDALELINQVKILKKIDFNLENICPTDISEYKSTWYYAANLINLFVNNLSKIVEAENAEAEKYLDFFVSVLDGNFDEHAISDTFSEMKKFLDFLVKKINMSYIEEDFKVINPSTAPKKLATALVNIRKLQRPGATSETLMRISKNPFDEIDKFYSAVEKFINLLSDKERKFNEFVDTASKESIKNYKVSFELLANNMMRKIDAIGGATNDNN